MQSHELNHEHSAAHDHHEHDDHEQSFLTKYVFSQDHKMIAKQFLVTAIVMAVIAMLMSIFFRMQLGWPDEKFSIMQKMLGK